MGQTKYTIDLRFQRHITSTKRGSPSHLHRAIRKHGTKIWKLEFLDECSTQQSANLLERFYIKRHNTFNNGYNLTEGGGGISGFKQPESQKIAVSKALKGRKKDPSTIEKQKLSLKKTLSSFCYIHPNTGRKSTDETKRKISENHHDVSGKNNPNYGVKMSNETKRKIGEKAKERNKNKLTCPHCGIKVGKTNYTRWHGNNCKHIK